MNGFREWPCDGGRVADIAAALAEIDGDLVVTDYDRRTLAAVELFETPDGARVRFRFARHRVVYGEGTRRR